MVEHVQGSSLFSPDFNRVNAPDRAMAGLAVAWQITAAFAVNLALSDDRDWWLWGFCLPFVVIAAAPLAMPTRHTFSIASWTAAGLTLFLGCAGFLLAAPLFLPAVLPLICAGTLLPKVRAPFGLLCTAAMLVGIIVLVGNA